MVFLIGSVSWAGAPDLGYAGSFPGAPPQGPMGSPFAGISRCLLPCSVLRLAPGFSGPAAAGFTRSWLTMMASLGAGTAFVLLTSERSDRGWCSQ